MLTALLLATKLMYTGVVVLVPSAKDPSLVRVVVPNGRIPQGSVPAHVPYVMFRMDQWVRTSRTPDLIFEDPLNGLQFGVCILDEEYLAVSGSFQSTALCKPTESLFPVTTCRDPKPSVAKPFPKVELESLFTEEDSLHWLLDLGYANPNIQTKIKDDVLQQKPQNHDVAMRMDLTAGRLTVVPESFDLHYGYRLNAAGTCQALARAVVVTVDDSSNPSTLELTSTSFTGTGKELPLQLSASSGDLVVLFGNEPAPHVQQAVNIYLGARPSVHHEDTTDHLQLIKRLLVPGTPLNVPREIPAGACQNGRSPATTGGAGGDGGTCNPSAMPATDPAAIGK